MRPFTIFSCICYSELPYSVLTEDSSVCLFVRDLKKPPATVGRQAKSATLADLTVRHYEQLLAAANIDTSAVTVMPLSQLFNEHYSLDQRRKLTYLYDKFIVEAPVATAVNAFLGAKLLYDGRAAFPVDLRAGDLASEWDVVLRQVFYQSQQAAEHLAAKPYICVGRQSHDVAQVAENIIDLLGQLGALHPGGAPNVAALYLRASGNVATAVQLYKDPATSAPVIPPPEVAVATPALNEDGTEAEVAAPVEKLTIKVPNLTQHLIDNHHYIVYDGEDDYTEEFGPDQPPKLTPQQQRAGGATAEYSNRRAPLQNQQYQQQNTHQQRANGVRQVASTVSGQTSNGSGGGNNVDELVMRGLKKLLGQQNLGQLVAGIQQGNGGNVRRMQQQQNGGGGHNNNGGGYVARRSINQQQQQQQQVMGRNQMTGGYVQRRRNANPMNGNNGVQRNNRRFI